MEKKQNRWGLIIGILVILFIAAYVFAGILSLLLGDVEVKKGNVALIPISGAILTGDSGGLFESGVILSSQVVEDIEDASKNPNIKAILFEINSPGGAPVATDEIARAIKEANKTTVAWIREIGTSGAYWVASSTDYVVANRMSITGSIGVYGSYLEFSGLMSDFNVTYERLVAGRYKDVGIPFRKLESIERELLQKKLDLLHQEFKNVIQKNRKLTNGEIEAVSTGEFYLGSEAKNLKLVDELGGKKEAIKFIESKFNITAELAEYVHKPSLLDILSELLSQRSFYFGKGLGQGLRESRVGWLE